MRVLNTDLAKQLDASSFGARFWRLRPGQASTKHQHVHTEELYILLEGRGRIRVDEEALELEPLDALLVKPASVRRSSTPPMAKRWNPGRAREMPTPSTATATASLARGPPVRRVVDLSSLRLLRRPRSRPS